MGGFGFKGFELFSVSHGRMLQGLKPLSLVRSNIAVKTATYKDRGGPNYDARVRRVGRSLFTAETLRRAGGYTKMVIMNWGALDE